MRPPINIFFSYAHEDEALREKLAKQLILLKRQGLIADWHDRNIPPGQEWKQEIDAHLMAADIILLLISDDFLASDYCYSIEVKCAMERHKAGEARVIPIILRPVVWEDAPFGTLQVLPPDGIPLTSKHWHTLDEAFYVVVQGLRRVIEEMFLSHENLLAGTVSEFTGQDQSAVFPHMWKMPYQRNPFFTGRDDILQQLFDALQTNEPATLTQPQAVSGLGGIGKTQIAIEYVYRYRFNYRAIFWVHADSYEMLISEMVSIAGEDLLNLPEKDEQEQRRIINAVMRWLNTHSSWLLIFDNVEDLTEVSHFFPRIMKGHILLTTRLRVTGVAFRSLEVETMRQEEAAQFLLRRAKRIALDAVPDHSSAIYAEAKQIASILDGLPLALDQAGAYIEETACSLPEYLMLYQKEHSTLLKRRGEFTSDHHEPVATTWALSFKKIERSDVTAAKLLEVCAFLSPDAISKEILHKGMLEVGWMFQSDIPTMFLARVIISKIFRYIVFLLTIPSLTLFVISIRGNRDGNLYFLNFKELFNNLRVYVPATAVSISQLKLNTTIETLLKYSLLHYEPKTNLFTIHRLVQAVLKDTMSERVKQRYANYIVRAVTKVFPESVAFSTWSSCQRYIPQVQACAELIKTWNITTPAVTNLLDQAGYYLYQRGQYENAEPLFQQVLAIRKQTQGANSPSVSVSLNYLAILYNRQGKGVDAERYYMQALPIWTKTLSPESFGMATCLSNLGSLYKDHGKDVEAELLLRLALETLENIEEEQVNPFNSFFTKVLPIRDWNEGAETKLQSKYVGTAISLLMLAEIYRNRKEEAEAELFCRQALAMYQKVPESPDTAACLQDLAELCWSQNKHTEAELLYQRALLIWRRFQSFEDLRMVTSFSSLAKIYKQQQRYTEAELLYQQALSFTEEVLGSDHSEVAIRLSDLVDFYMEQDEYTKAEPLCLRMLEIEHHEIVSSLFILAEIYYSQGRDGEAWLLMQQALDTYDRLFLSLSTSERSELIDNLTVNYNDKIEFYRYRGESAKADMFSQRVSVLQQQVSESSNFDVIRSLPDAEEHPEKQDTPEDLSLAHTLYKLGIFYSIKSRFPQADLLLQRALVIYEQVQGPEHINVAKILYRLAISCQAQGRYDQAVSFMRRALAVYEQSLGPTHHSTIQLLKDYRNVLRRVEQEMEARDIEARISNLERKEKQPKYLLFFTLCLFIIPVIVGVSQRSWWGLAGSLLITLILLFFTLFVWIADDDTWKGCGCTVSLLVGLMWGFIGWLLISSISSIVHLNSLPTFILLLSAVIGFLVGFPGYLSSAFPNIRQDSIKTNSKYSKYSRYAFYILVGCSWSIVGWWLSSFILMLAHYASSVLLLPDTLATIGFLFGCFGLRSTFKEIKNVENKVLDDFEISSI